MKSSMEKCTLFALLIFTAIFAFGPMTDRYVSAADKETAQFNVNTSMVENLTTLKGKAVTIYLASGQTITGTINDVKGNLLHLGRLSQKDFYDALVAVDRISSIEMKVR
ncbi:MAG: hypothetical protein ABFD97_08655 [Syntrophobacter sp.]